MTEHAENLVKHVQMCSGHKTQAAAEAFLDSCLSPSWRDFEESPQATCFVKVACDEADEDETH